ncbi:hypothetical protein GIB67_042097 [Kingdonia uniflora]|uniref:DNA-directed primase/polymerase protein n=1 Tax=Kingdonia uniflora TaxID=39325 RepID=A0A7J7MVX1_9MAGN|nr:hypothetical protein GIB67_042097 [Kingdonia uniflora]
MDSRFRHHYEVIQEVRTNELLPSLLFLVYMDINVKCDRSLRRIGYFDLEFDKRVNADKDGEEMVDLMISVIIDAIFDKYSIQGNHDWVIELDSSTEGLISLLCCLISDSYIAF